MMKNSLQSEATEYLPGENVQPSRWFPNLREVRTQPSRGFVSTRGKLSFGRGMGILPMMVGVFITAETAVPQLIQTFDIILGD
jgi:hypothetical protein